MKDFKWWDDLVECMGVFGWGAFGALILMNIVFRIIDMYMYR